MTDVMPHIAMVLAAGYGTRMRPLTLLRPKPLVTLAGRTLLDHVLDRLVAVGVPRAVVNVHYLAEQVMEHVAHRQAPQVIISDERDMLLETGGGVVKALPLLGDERFFHFNSDTVWTEEGESALSRLALNWDEDRMDMLLLLSRPDRAVSYNGRGDFILSDDGRLRRREKTDGSAPVYMGAAIIHPRICVDAPSGSFSLNLFFDRAIAQGRLFGLVHQGWWMDVGTPESLARAEEYLLEQRETHGAGGRDSL